MLGTVLWELGHLNEGKVHLDKARAIELDLENTGSLRTEGPYRGLASAVKKYVKADWEAPFSTS